MALEGIGTLEDIELPRIVEIEDCDFPIVEADPVGGYRVLILPEAVQKLFDAGAHAVRINGTRVGEALPDFGGKSNEGRSLLAHQDHPSADSRRYLALTKKDPGERGSETLLIPKAIAAAMLPETRAYFDEHREELMTEAVYGENYQITEEQFRQCTADGGLEAVIRDMCEKNPGVDRLFVESGILGYFIRNERADALLEKLLKKYGAHITAEEWRKPGTLIIDNAAVFHGRRGPNVPVQRNWLIAKQPAGRPN